MVISDKAQVINFQKIIPDALKYKNNKLLHILPGPRPTLGPPHALGPRPWHPRMDGWG